VAKEKFSARQVANALTETKGMVTLAAKRLNCDYNTVIAYINRYDGVRKARDTAREEMGDAAELKLYQQAVNEGNTTALIFLLKTQFRNRGYTEKLLIEGNIQLELVNQVVKAAEAAGVDASEVFNAIIAELAAVGANSETGN